ncbi:MAG: nucleoside-diphosphate sugar epimerase/dehydratase, partial [Chloroflexota bacterium]
MATEYDTRSGVAEAPEPATVVLAQPEAVAQGRPPVLEVSERKALLLTGDLLCIGTALFGTILLRHRAIAPQHLEVHWFLTLAAVWLLVAPIAGCYDLKTASKAWPGIASALRAGALAVGLYFLIPYLSAPLLSSRLHMLTFAAGSLGLLALWRYAYTAVLWQPRFQTRTIVVGAGNAGREIVRVVDKHSGAAYEVLGFVDDDPAKAGTVVDGYPVVGGSDKLAELVRSFGVQEVIIAITGDMREELPRSLYEAFQAGVRVTPMADLYETLTSRVAVDHAGEHWYVALPR